MLNTYRGIADEHGRVKIVEPVKLEPGQYVLVTVLDNETIQWLSDNQDDSSDEE